MRNAHIQLIYASTSGHTEYAVCVVLEALRAEAPMLVVRKSMAESCGAADFLADDFLVLAAGSWSVGGAEGQLNPYMSRLLNERANTLNLDNKPCACIGLGDHRYFYTARALDLLQQYVASHGGRLIIPGLRLVNEPYGQEESIHAWARALVSAADHSFQ